MSEAADLSRRFGGVARLHGEHGLAAFAAARACVVGIGGVGSWAVEALARNGFGTLTLIDLDMIAESNTNRQIHALGEVWGRAKVDAMAERVRAINPACRVRCVEEFLTEENLENLLAGQDAVLDAIDNVRVKVAMVAWARRTRTPLVVCGGAGGKRDPSRIRVDDLCSTEQDPLLAKVRARLRKEHGFPREAGRKFGIEAVYSGEPLARPQVCEAPGLACAGYGSDVCVTASIGLFAAARVLQQIEYKHSLRSTADA